MTQELGSAGPPKQSTPARAPAAPRPEPETSRRGRSHLVTWNNPPPDCCVFTNTDSIVCSIHVITASCPCLELAAHLVLLDIWRIFEFLRDPPSAPQKLIGTALGEEKVK